jgi:hypothetical protein
MTEPAPSSDITLLLQRAGFALTPVQIAEYTEAYGYITEMAARIRSPRSYMAEPAHVFSPAVAATEVTS